MVGSGAMSYEAYKVIHLFGVVFLFTAVGGSVFLRFGGARRALEEAGADVRKVTGIVHGVTLLLIIISGFGIVARLGLMQDGMPAWLWLKLGIWLVLGAALPMARKMPRAAGILWWLLPLLGTVAAWLAIYKP
jgi:hypothetical protein